jgi:hypothetical protein
MRNWLANPSSRLSGTPLLAALRCGVWLALTGILPLSAVTLDPLGTQANITWPVSWTALSNNTDAFNSLAQNDIVGSATYPAGYYAQDSNFVYLRMRLAATEPIGAGSFADSHFFLIDRIGYGNEGGLPDYGFAWDSKSANILTHGLEMDILGTAGATWSATNMNDLDGANGSKGITDINGSGRTTDGYLRVIDGQATPGAAWGNTSTFMDVAVSWNYLQTYTNLGLDQEWKILFATINNSNDHGFLSTDIGGGAVPTDAISTTPWSGPIATPEPGSMALLGLGSLAGLWWQRRRGKNAPPKTDSQV